MFSFTTLCSVFSIMYLIWIRCDQRIAVTSILERVHENTLLLTIDRRPTGTSPLLQMQNATFDGIIVPFVSLENANDRAALQLALRLRRNAANANLKLTLLHLEIGESNGQLENELLDKLAKKVAKEGLVCSQILLFLLFLI